MNNIKNNPWLITLPRNVLWLFIICNIFSIAFYPGSTYFDHLTKTYLFTENFLSDLGRTITFSGKNNFLSSQLFNTSLILSGIIFAIFYINVYKIFINEKLLSFIGSFFGALGGISLAGVGLTPANLYLNLHIIFANWLFRFMFLASVLYTIVIFINIRLQNKYALGYLLFTASIFIYILISEFGPSPNENKTALIVQVVSQKIILFIFMISIYIQTFSLKQYNKNEFL